VIALTLKEQPTVPLEAESISPDAMSGLSHEAVRALPVFLGKRRRRLDDFFEVEGAGSDELEDRVGQAEGSKVGVQVGRCAERVSDDDQPDIAQQARHEERRGDDHPRPRQSASGHGRGVSSEWAAAERGWAAR